MYYNVSMHDLIFRRFLRFPVTWNKSLNKFGAFAGNCYPRTVPRSCARIEVNKRT